LDVFLILDFERQDFMEGRWDALCLLVQLNKSISHLLLNCSLPVLILNLEIPLQNVKNWQIGHRTTVVQASALKIGTFTFRDHILEF